MHTAEAAAKAAAEAAAAPAAGPAAPGTFRYFFQNVQAPLAQAPLAFSKVARFQVLWLSSS